MYLVAACSIAFGLPLKTGGTHRVRLPLLLNQSLDYLSLSNQTQLEDMSCAAAMPEESEDDFPLDHIAKKMRTLGGSKPGTGAKSVRSVVVRRKKKLSAAGTECSTAADAKGTDAKGKMTREDGPEDSSAAAAHRMADQASCNPPLPCLFLCGDDTGSVDPVAKLQNPGKDPSRLPRIKWGRGKVADRWVSWVEKGSVQACWYCERIYQKDANLYGGRKECQKELCQDKTKAAGKFTKWTEERQQLIKSKSKGQRYIPSGARKKLKQKQKRQCALIAPRAKFWHYNEYVVRFGHPKSAENKRRGHRVATFGGRRGVIVPGEEDTSVPWDIENKYLDETVLSTELNRQESGDDDDFDDELQQQYDAITAKDDNEFERLCQGQSFAEMMREIAEQEEAATQKQEEEGELVSVGRRLCCISP